MYRYQSNKQAFAIAAVIILLCLVCLTGSTLALFTSDTGDGTIGIITTSGSVKVDIVDTTSEQNSLENKYLHFYTSSDRKEILFEPGATFYTQGFKIKNRGDVPINFRLSVSEDKDIDMTAFHEAFEVWISTSRTDPTGAQKLTTFVGRLEAGADTADTYYLYIKMKESADNKFQGQTYAGIGITVYAVQGNVEIKE
jgi:hypothetical protein